MEFRLKKEDGLFFIACLGLGFVAEQSFLHDKIGVSYLLFITCFYAVFFWRFRFYPFTNKRLGLFMMAAIWLLAASFLLRSNMVLYLLNILVIPALMLSQLVLITYPLQDQWHKWPFVQKLFLTVGAVIMYVSRFLLIVPRLVGKGMEEKTASFMKKIFIGLAISFPLLFLIINLLISADQQFGELLGTIPQWLSRLEIEEEVLRTIAVLFYSLSIFGLLQVLRSKQSTQESAAEKSGKMAWDSVVSVTVLVLLNLVYLLFVVVQFKYFFSETLQEGYTYAEFARRGFFELLFVTMLNLLIISTVVSFINMNSRGIKLAARGLLSLLVLFSGIMLYSAFIRLFMYEEAYGFTFARVIAHAFMIFLLVILVYSFMRIWMEKLSLVRFYILSSILFYTIVNTIQLDQFVVEQNLKRYKETGKIDIYYLNSLSYDGVEGLVELYRLNPKHPGLEKLLRDRKQEFLQEDDSWNSFNFSKRSAKKTVLALERM